MSRYCERCDKAKPACICRWVQPIACATELVILQHPSEVKRALGTAKILTLALANARLFIAEDFTEHAELNQLLAEKNVYQQLLYPHASSVELQQLRSQAAGSDIEPPTLRRLILLDGTWKKTYKMLQLSKNLQQLECVHLNADLRGNYRVRKAPSAAHLSTVEAGYQALSVLEPELNGDTLLAAFTHMVDYHIAQMPAGVYAKNYQARS